MEEKWVAIAFAAVIISMFIGMSIDETAKSNERIEYAKMGLQQCIEDGETLWKKECK